MRVKCWKAHVMSKEICTYFSAFCLCNVNIPTQWTHSGICKFSFKDVSIPACTLWSASYNPTLMHLESALIIRCRNSPAHKKLVDAHNALEKDVKWLNEGTDAEDRLRWNKVKVGGIPGVISPWELPVFLKHLLLTIMPAVPDMDLALEHIEYHSRKKHKETLWSEFTFVM